MSKIVTIVMPTSAAGCCIPTGEVITSFERIGPTGFLRNLAIFIYPFGDGMILGSAIIVLVPEATKNMAGSLWGIPAILAGGLSFFLILWALGTFPRCCARFL